MAKLTRIIHKIFGINAGFAPSQEMGKVGSLANGTPEYASNAEEVASLPAFESGLNDIVLTNNSPAMQDINGIFHHTSRQVGYLYEQGIPEWIATQTYYLNGFCSVSGKIYKSIQNTNLNHDPTASGSTWWVEVGVITWNANIAYAINDVVSYGGKLYTSQDANTGNIPSENGSTHWATSNTSITITCNLSAVQNIPQTTETVVNFDFVQNDVLSEITTGANWKFIPKNAGMYEFNARASFNSAYYQSNEAMILHLKLNDLLNIRLDEKGANAPATCAFTIQGTEKIFLVPDNEVQITVINQRAGGTGLGYLERATQLLITKL
jgi:hypothetical protein